MAINTINGVWRVYLVFNRVEFVGRVTLEANGRTWGAQFQAVWIVTVAACHTSLVHPALEKGAMDEYLVKHLSIRVV